MHEHIAMTPLEQVQIERDALRAELEATTVSLERTRGELERVRGELVWWVEQARRTPRTAWSRDF